MFDIETTGFSPKKNKIIEIGAVKVVDGRITDKFSTFVNPDVPIPFDIEKLTGINDSMVLPYPKIDVILPQFLEFVGDAVLVAHNASFDVGFIGHFAEKLELPFDPTVLDTVAIARLLLPNLNRFKLDTVAKALNISLQNHHRAVDDAGATAEIFAAFVKMLRDRDVNDLNQLNALSTMDTDTIRKLPTHHVIILDCAVIQERHRPCEHVPSGELVPPGVLCQKAQDTQEPAGEIPGGTDYRIGL